MRKALMLIRYVHIVLIFFEATDVEGMDSLVSQLPSQEGRFDH